jgi:hypothetical protein
MRSFPLLFCLIAVTALAGAQEPPLIASDALRHPGWNYGIQFFGGTATMSIPPIPHEPSRYASSAGAAFHLARVLTQERGESWRRGTLECDFNVIPVDFYLINGRHYYAGGLEAIAPRWNFTARRDRFVPFVGAAGGILFTPQKFPPGNTSQVNLTVALDLGAHVFTRGKRSLDVTTRLHHLSNAGWGKYNPGVPLSLQVLVGFTWY